LDVYYITRSYEIVARTPEERIVKKVFENTKKKKRLLGSLEKDGWTVLKMI
jgi:hypothetical protein